MEDNVTFLDCPAYLDARGSTRCGLPAEVEDRYIAQSSDGPLECARIQCPRGHWFNGPLESLIWAVPPARTSPAETSPARTSPARTSPARTSPAETSPARDGWPVRGEAAR